MEEIRSVGVVGLGVMGFDIAFLYALSGYRTVVFDASKSAMETLNRRVDQTIDRLQRRNRILESEAANVRENFVAGSGLDALCRLDLVTEAVSETEAAKLAVYKALREGGFEGILTTNTSSLTRARLVAAGAYEGAKFASTHFFNPVLYTRIVEVVRGSMDESRFRSTIAFLKKLGRNPVETRDISGFVSNSILMYLAVMALRLLQRGGRIEDIDQSAENEGLLPPLVSYDSWKPSIVEDVTRVMFDTRGDAFLRSSTLLAALAQSNPNFYLAQQPNGQIYHSVERDLPTLDPAAVRQALRASIQVAAARVVELGEDPARVDHISLEGLKFREGPLKQIDRLGARAVLQDVEQVNHVLADAPLSPSTLLVALARERQTFFTDGQPNPWIQNFLGPKQSHARI